jgi:hypothetical protein
MSWRDVILYGPGWAAVPLMILKWVIERRWARQDREQH